MNYYGAIDLAAAFRTVRGNTIKAAEDIDEQHYGFRATPESRSIAETLLHILHIPDFSQELHGVRQATTLEGFDFMSFMQPRLEDEKKPHSKAAIVKALRESGDEFAAWLEGLSDEFLAQPVGMPHGAQPPTKSRFEMILGVKEHEMHHRAQLFLLSRMVGVVPHLTRAMEERRAAMRAAAPAAKS